MLTGPEILNQINDGKIVIEPFTPDQLNPNSYDLRLAPGLKCYKNRKLYHGEVNEVEHILFEENCDHILIPGYVYIASTVEYTETHPPYIPQINGKSSIGRLGISVHVTAGFGDMGFKGNWTLEMTCVQPVVLRAGIKIAQISYHLGIGEPTSYEGKYQNQRGPTSYIPDTKGEISGNTVDPD